MILYFNDYFETSVTTHLICESIKLLGMYGNIIVSIIEFLFDEVIYQSAEH